MAIRRTPQSQMFRFSVCASSLIGSNTGNQHGSREELRVIGAAVVTGGAVGALSWGGHLPIYATPGFWVCGFFSLFGLFLLLRSFRRIEAAAFFTSAGVHRLTVAKIGPDV